RPFARPHASTGPLERSVSASSIARGARSSDSLVDRALEPASGTRSGFPTDDLARKFQLPADSDDHSLADAMQVHTSASISARVNRPPRPASRRSVLRIPGVADSVASQVWFAASAPLGPVLICLLGARNRLCTRLHAGHPIAGHSIVHTSARQVDQAARGSLS